LGLKSVFYDCSTACAFLMGWWKRWWWFKGVVCSKHQVFRFILWQDHTCLFL